MIKTVVLNPHGSDETYDSDRVTIREVQFLTHTVQMKLLKQLFQNVIIRSVLNPHGSDKTVFARNTDIILDMFLTHTVQIKLQLTVNLQYIAIIVVLNPHGSDKT